MFELQKFQGVKVLCLGDVMLDCFVSGDVNRISPEGPVPVLCVNSKQYFAGGAANVARNIASLGARCTLVGVIGRDPEGEQLTSLLETSEGIDTRLIEVANRSTTIKMRFLGQNQQMLRVDHENNDALSKYDEAKIIQLVCDLVRSHSAVVLSDYAKGLLSESVVRAIVTESKNHGVPVIVDPKTADLSRYSGASVVTPNLREAYAASGIQANSDDESNAASELILSRFQIDSVLITRAEKGMTLAERGKAPLHIRSNAREVFDVVGAGDTVVATLAVGLGGKLHLPEAARIANFAAGIVVGRRGTATVSIADLHTELMHDTHNGIVQPTSKICTWNDIRELSGDWRNSGLTVGFTNGCFDILHVGHIRTLQFAREHCERLVVGINSDQSVRRLKGESRPINSQEDRAELLSALSFVDAVVIFSQDTPLELIEAISPKTLVKGGDYQVETIVGAEYVLKHGGKVLTCEIVRGKSTTDTIRRVQGI